MPADLVLLAAPVLGLLSAGGFLVARWFGLPPPVRALRAARRHSVRGFPEGGAGRIVGTIEAHEGKLVRAPVSGRACVAYSVLVEEYESQGRGGSWKAIVEDFDAVPFVVADETGRALVRAEGSWPTPVMETVSSAGMFEGAAPALEALLNAAGLSSHGLVFNKTLRCEEGVLGVGMRVAVLGLGRREAGPLDGDPAGGYREKQDRLVIDCLDDGRLLMSNDPRALR